MNSYKIYNGQHFGEIRLIYGCPRTASVASKSYNITCKMDKNQYQAIIKKYPVFQDICKRHVYKYTDSDKDFFYTYLQRMTILKEEGKQTINVGLLHDLMYSFEKFTFDEGDYVLQEGDVINSLLLVESGQLEMITSIENLNEFSVLKIGRGSIINLKNVFLES